VPLGTEETRKRLTAFVDKWISWAGSEKGAAQPFLAELLACYGTEWKSAGVKFEFRLPSGAFVDMLWPGVCLIEMKRPTEVAKLSSHYTQAFGYWSESGSGEHEPPPFIVLSAFGRFQVWKPGYPEPHAEFGLSDLPERGEALAFLGGGKPEFEDQRAELTREAVTLVTDLFGQLEQRGAESPEVLREFILQCVWCMFAEDLGLLPPRIFARLLTGLIKSPHRSSEDDLGGLFERLATPGEPRPQHGTYAGAPYVNGQLFEKPARVYLLPEEVAGLRDATLFDWTLVEPAIFGWLLEGALGRERQWRFGAHYTSEEDIMKVVGPTVLEPWVERIASIDAIEDLRAAQDDLSTFTILDPACGSGNFLYVAYRELRDIELQLATLEGELCKRQGLEPKGRTGLFTLDHVYGIDNEPFAIRLARVTLWMGHAQFVREHKLDERILPLPPLPGIVFADALKLEWPSANGIVGNPPYHGSQQIRSQLGDTYAEWLQQEFGIGLKDFAVYWFRKAHAALPDGGRAGFVATNSVSQGRARKASLEWILANGGVITNAVSTQDWPGAAAVDVSIVNWVKSPVSPPKQAVLDGEAVTGITAALRAYADDTSGAARLAPNRGRAFQGPQPVGSGFVLKPEEAQELLALSDADYHDVVRPYLIGEDILQTADQYPTRYIIDFGTRTLEDALKYPAALDLVRARVKPFRDQNRRATRRTKWWLLGELVPAMRAALAPLARYLATSAVAKRFQFVWCDRTWCPSNRTIVFALSEDFDIGVLTSAVHVAWASVQGGTFEDRPHYTHTTAFETFPWPQPTRERREEVAAAARALVRRRGQICLERQIGLTKLYNELHDGAYTDLRDLHRRLDESVVAAYGWPKAAAHDPADSNRRLLLLNRAIAAGEVEYDPF